MLRCVCMLVCAFSLIAPAAIAQPAPTQGPPPARGRRPLGLDPISAVLEGDPGLPGHTIYRPQNYESLQPGRIPCRLWPGATGAAPTQINFMLPSWRKSHRMVSWL